MGAGPGAASAPAGWACTGAAGLGGGRGWEDDGLARFRAAAASSFSLTVTSLWRGTAEGLKGFGRGWAEDTLARFLAAAAAPPCCLAATSF